MMRMGKGKKFMFFMFLAPIFMALFAFVGGEIVKMLWNWLMPEIFGWRVISFWQALGLLVLSKILFGGFKVGGRHWGRHQWKNDMTQRWDSMSGEEKEKFRGEWEKRCGRRFGRPFEETKPAENA